MVLLPMLCQAHSLQIRTVPSMPAGGLQKCSWENEISHISDPAQSSSVCAGVPSENRHPGVQIPWLLTCFVPSVTHQHLPSIEQSRCVFCFLWCKLCKSLWRTSVECWHSKKPEISAFIPRKIFVKVLLLKSF